MLGRVSRALSGRIVRCASAGDDESSTAPANNAAPLRGFPITSKPPTDGGWSVRRSSVRRTGLARGRCTAGSRRPARRRGGGSHDDGVLLAVLRAVVARGDVVARAAG